QGEHDVGPAGEQRGRLASAAAEVDRQARSVAGVEAPKLGVEVGAEGEFHPELIGTPDVRRVVVGDLVVVGLLVEAPHPRPEDTTIGGTRNPARWLSPAPRSPVDRAFGAAKAQFSAGRDRPPARARASWQVRRARPSRWG